MRISICVGITFIIVILSPATVCNSEQITINLINSFCLGKSKTNFCSEQNIKHLVQALKIQNEEKKKNERLIEMIRLEYEAEQLRYEAEQLRHEKLKNFIIQNPKYKMLMEFDAPRFY